jgi:hypothetical protein
MPKPQDTFLRQRSVDKTKNAAEASKRVVSSSKEKERQEFYSRLGRASESHLEARHKAMTKLAGDLKRNEPLSKDAKVRKAVAEVVEEVEKFFEKVKDYKELDAALREPMGPLLQASRTLASEGATLALVIAICKVIEVLVRLRRSKSRH